MIVLLKILAIIFALLFLVKLKVDLGIVLALDAVLTAVLFGMPVGDFFRQAGSAAIAPETLNLIGIVILVLYLGHFLHAGGHFKEMVAALKNYIRDARLILAIPSAFIGLLPMTAGAMMGAPIVEEAAQRWKLSPAWKTFLNYWFRHIWEYSWPMYVNLIMAATIVGIPIVKVCLSQLPFTVIAVAVGLAILFRHVPYTANDEVSRPTLRDLVRTFTSIWPIFLTIILIFVLRIPMLWALAAACVLSAFFVKMPARERWEVVRKSVSLRIILLTAAVMIFKRILETSGALDAVMTIVSPTGISGIVLLFAAPFTIGFLTGVNQAFAGIAFPLLVPIIGKENPDMVLFLFAYVSGFVGILLSPAHLCLALTADYFHADLRDVYKILIGPVSVIFGAALIALVVFRLL
jgi:integral membrane protein (TIGR00529 family)